MQTVSEIITLFDEDNSIVAFKKLLREQAEELKARFDPHHSVLKLLHGKSEFIDNVLSAAWNHFLGDKASALSLLAVGGYGRRELFPHSDIDILILLDDSNLESYQEKLSGFSNFLWDIGLDPGLSVRTVAECVQAAIDDQTVMTTLLEMRLIQGNAGLFEELVHQRDSRELWSSEQFFAAKMEEQRQRYRKANDTAFNLEPDTKQGPGGLRDLQVIAWVFKHHYKSATLKELIKYDFLPEREYIELQEARNILWRIRYALHLLTDRHEDRLLFDYQRELATQFGFTAEKQNQNIEEFMQFYFKTVVGLERLNEMLLQLFSERFVCPRGDCKPEDVNEHFVEINGYLEARSSDIFQKNPHLLLEIFLILQKNPHLKGTRATTIRLVRKSLEMIDDDFRHDKRINHLFIEILRQPHGITHQLRRMNRYGVLAAYLPYFANIVARMQYDLFHIYTVDVHTLFVIGNLRRFALESHREELPFCYDVFQLIPKPEVIYLAALFHDIAKGMGGDHSELGEDIALQFCKQHGLSSHDGRLIAWLVRNHLLMSMTAQRKDISDPDIIYEFASQVGNIEHLNYLYLLTVADIRATNPTLWNSWKDSLLQELYNVSLSTLHRNLQNPVTVSERLRENKKEACDELLKLGLTETQIENAWLHTSDDYFLRYTTDEIVWHTQAITRSDEKDLPLVLLRPQAQRGSAEVFVYAENEGAIFSISTGSLDQLGLTILDARIVTTADQYVLNSFQVIEQSGEPISDDYRRKHICEALRGSLLKKKIGTPKNIHRQSRQARHFPIRSSVGFHEDPLERHSIMELVTTDRAGLLSRIGQVFIQEDVQLHDAKITTIGSRAEDIFYITDREGTLLTQEKEKGLRKAVLEKLEENW